MGADKVEMVFRLDSLNAVDVARKGMEVLGLQDAQVNLYGKGMNANTALQKIAKDGKPFFNIESDGASIHFSTMKAYQQQLLTIFKKDGLELSAWEKIVESFVGYEGFTQACLLSDEYMLWQNAADPIQYEAAGRSYKHLPLVSNGLPSPLQKLIVDTSHNPGRRIIKIGYLEIVGYVMWFGRPFWGLVGERHREAMLTSSAYQVTRKSNDIIRVIASNQPFVDDSSKAKQEDLRRLLFD
jgi:hypothetical protein